MFPDSESKRIIFCRPASGFFLGALAVSDVEVAFETRVFG